MATLSPCPKLQFFDNEGKPAAGFKLYTYTASTTTPQATYADRAGEVANANPIILDARGECVAYLAAGQVYDFALTTANDTQVWTRNGITADSSGADAVMFTQSGTDAVSRPVQDKLREAVSPEDFGAVGSGSVDDAPAIQKALNASRVVRLKPGSTYRLSQAIVVPSNTTIIAEGATITRSGSLNNMLRNYASGSAGGYSAARGITIIGGTWDSTGGTGNCTVMGFGHAERIHIERATIRNDNQWHHIEFSACAQATVVDCAFIGGRGQEYNGNEAIQIDSAVGSAQFPWFGPYDGTYCHHIQIKGNYFSDCGVGVGTHTESPNINHQDISIVDNVFDDLYYYAIVGLTWSAVKIRGNRIEGAGGGVLFEQNTSRDNNDITITDNSIYTIGAGTHPDAGRGVHLNGNSTCGCRNFRIANNLILSVTGSGQHGIAVDFGKYGGITGNTVETVNRSGVILYGAAMAVTVANNTVSGNNGSGGGYESYRLGMLNGSLANRVIVSNNYGATLRAEYMENTIVTHNNLSTSLTQTNNEATFNATDNLVGGTFS